MRNIAFLILVAVTCGVFLIYGLQDDANAAEDQRCKFIGVTNIYAGPGNTVDLFTDKTYRDHRCSVRGDLKVDKVVYNTPKEYRDLRTYVKGLVPRIHLPIAMCWDGERGRMWASSWTWDDFKKPVGAVREKYEAFLHRTGCKVYG